MWTPIARKVELPWSTVEDIYWKFERDRLRQMTANGANPQQDEVSQRLLEHLPPKKVEREFHQASEEDREIENLAQAQILCEMQPASDQLSDHELCTEH